MSKPTASISMGSPTSPVQGAPKTSSMAVASMVCGIVGILVFGIILGSLAIIFGVIAMNRINEKPLEWEGRGMAKAGIICGVIGIVLNIVWLAIVISNQ